MKTIMDCFTNKYLAYLGVLALLLFQGCREEPRVNDKPQIAVEKVDPKQTAHIREEILEDIAVAKRHKDVGDIESALLSLQDAMMLAQSYLDPDDSLAIDLMYRLGYYQGLAGYIPSSLRSFKNGLKTIYTRDSLGPKDSLLLGNFYNSIAAQYNRLMMFDSAEAASRISLPIRAAAYGSNSHKYAMGLSVLGEVLKSKGDFAAADSVMQLQLAIELPLGVGLQSAMAYQSLGDLHLEMRDSSKALQYFQAGRALLDARDSTHAYTLAKIHEGLARASASQQPKERTLELFDLAIDHMKRAADKPPRETALIELNRGDFELLSGDAGDALETYHSALRHFSNGIVSEPSHIAIPQVRLGREPGVFLALCGKAKAWRNSDAQCAMDNFQLAFSFADKLRRTYGSYHEKINLKQWIMPEVEAALGMAHAQYENEGGEQYLHCIYEFMERSKANDMLDGLDQVDISAEYSLPDSIIARGRHNAEALEAIRRSPPIPKDKLPTLAQLQEDSAQLQAWIQAHHRGFAAPGPRIVDWDTLRNVLSTGPDTLVVSYFKGAHHLYILAFAGARDTAIALTWDHQLDTAIQRFGRGCSAPRLSRQKRAHLLTDPGYMLFSQLLRPAMTICGKGHIPQRLIVVPDGQLAFIPFEALLTAQSHDNTSDRDLPYLVKTTAVSYIQSLQLQHRLQGKKNKMPSKKFLGIGSSLPMGDAQRLPKSAEEAIMVVHKMGGELSLDSLATEGRVKSRIPFFANFHFSTHGKLDDKQPLRSYLSLHEDMATGDDGKLMAYEIYDLPLDAQLSVLSACETAKGQDPRGIGVMSIGNAFHVAGCKNVIMTLEAVKSAPSKQLMETFYDSLATGMDAANALRSTKKQFISTQDPDEALPFYWARFILQGPGDLNTKPESGSFLQWFLAALALLIIWAYRQSIRSQ